jgi:DNA-binding winged helix-turn-helix (wHTH) protein
VRIRFGEFRLDTDRRELSRRSEIVRLTPKAFQLLQLLAEARPDAVSQKSLHDALWPDSFVNEGSLHNLIYQARRALNDGAHETIRTVYGFGFSFAADVADAGVLGQCQLIVGEEDFTLREGENVIGREWDAAVRINASSISRRHARIVIDGRRAILDDLRSKNGTWLEGHRLRGPRELENGDQILFGTVTAKFLLLAVPSSTETARRDEP